MIPVAQPQPRKFKAYAVVEALRNGSADIKSALVPFFHPCMAFKNGQIFDTNEIAQSVNDSYSWQITPDIVEGLIPAFLECGWLKTIQSTDNSAAYRVSCTLPDGTFYSNLPEDLKELSLSFERFIKEISPLSASNRLPDHLLDVLLRWIVSLEAYSDSELKTEIIKTLDEGKRSVYDVVQSRDGISQDDQFLCARFSKSLVESDSPMVSILSDVARIGLLTETVQDFAKPTTSVKRTSLAIYLDAPVAMDFLDVSGTAAKENIRPIILRLQAIGASIRVFDTSVEEIQRNLSAMLKRPEPLRTGITATAIRRRQVLESYVRQVAAKPEQALISHGIQTVSRSLIQFPNDHPFFTEDDYKQLYTQVKWHIEDAPRAHDALIVTNVMRMRRGTHTTDIFDCMHVLITRNGILPEAAKRLAVDSGRLPKNSIGPVVHQRELATAVWLRAGLDSADGKALPLRYLMSSCERVLQIRPDVIEKVRQQAKLRSPETAEQLDLLLTADRSTEMLMDKTLNVSSVVTEHNIEQLIQDMRESLIAEKISEHKQATARMKKEYRLTTQQAREDAEREIAAETEAAQSAIKESTKLRSFLEEREAEDNISIDALINDTNFSISKRQRLVNKSVTVLGIIAGLLSAFLAYEYPNATTLTFFVSIATVFSGHISGQIRKILPYGEVSEELALSMLWGKANERGLSAKLQRHSISFDSGRLSLSLPA